MGKYVIRTPVISVNGVDLSDHCREASVPMERDTVDVTAFGDNSRNYLVGIGDSTITATFYQDFATGSVDLTLWPLFNTAGSVFPVTIKPTNGTVSNTNPLYQGSFVLPSYTPMDGAVGDASVINVTFQNAGTAGITRGTT